jgi:hypothetical protein
MKNLPPREWETPMEVIMFDSIEDQMKNVAMEGTTKEKWTKYIVISAVSIAVVGGIFAAVQFIK